MKSDTENNIIKVNLTLTNGATQQLVDKIKFVTKDQIVSEFIQSSKSTNSYFQYYLDAKSKSIIKLKYKKENGIIGLDGPKIQSYCENVKADWDMSKKENICIFNDFRKKIYDKCGYYEITLPKKETYTC